MASKQHAPKAPQGHYDPHFGQDGRGDEAFDAFRANGLYDRGGSGGRNDYGGTGQARRGYAQGAPGVQSAPSMPPQPQYRPQPQPQPQPPPPFRPRTPPRPRQAPQARQAPRSWQPPQAAQTPQATPPPRGPQFRQPPQAPQRPQGQQAPQTQQIPAYDDIPEVYGHPRGSAPAPQWDGGEAQEWDPSEEDLRPVRGRHRVGKQRGSMARSTAVLGVGMIAAVGAGGMATAKDKNPSAVHMPDLASAAHSVKNIPDKLPDAHDLPGIGHLVNSSSGSETKTMAGRQLTGAGLTDNDAAKGRTDAGEALRSRIMAQAQQQQTQADASARAKAAQIAADKAQAAAHKKAEAEHKAAQERKRKAEEAKRRKEEAERRAKLARSYTLPVTSYQLTAGFGQAGGMWENDHTGQDFAVPTGTPIKALHSGTITSAGWAGSYGYRTVLKLDDGTELWFCHQSSMTVKAGEKVSTGEVIGRVGATGNVTGPHLHLEVRPGGGKPIDPMPWLRDKGMHP